jgi:hypothetical protein
MRFDPTGVIIDGALPRTERERCTRLIDVAHTLADNLPPNIAKTPYYDQLAILAREADGEAIDPDHGMLTEVEDDIITTMHELLTYYPGELTLYVGEPDPGDVIIIAAEEAEREGFTDPRGG